MIGANYPRPSDAEAVQQVVRNSEFVTVMTLGELLPMSFGPEALKVLG